MMNKSFWIALIMATGQAIACLRPTPDKRAIQWSEAIVHAKLTSIADATNEIYHFEVTDSIDGTLKAGQDVAAHHITPNPAEPSCAGHLTADDVGKNFLVMLRHGDKDSFVIVNISTADKIDPSAADAFKQLIEETRKAEASLSDDQIKAQALAYANAQDDTEADQAEKTLTEMGYKAVPIIRQVMNDAPDIGKQRLKTLLRDLAPPNEIEPATKPTTQP